MVLITSRSADVLADIIHDRQVAISEYQLLNETTLALALNTAAPVIRRLRHAGYVVDVQGVKMPQFDDTELALLAQLVQAATNHDDRVRQLQYKISQLRRKGHADG
jgi:hypothetical protein